MIEILTARRFFRTSCIIQFIILGVASAADPAAPTSLMISVRNTDIEGIKASLEHGGDVNARDRFGTTALMYLPLKASNSLEVASFLLEHGASVNARDDFGGTELEGACTAGNVKLVEMLIKAGSDVDAASTQPTIDGGNISGLTPLIAAAMRGHDEVVETLIAAGAHVNMRTSAGWTALMYACNKRRASTVRILLSHDANTTGTEGGETPLTLAKKGKYTPIVELLEQKK